MPIVKCSINDCDFETEDLAEAIVSTLFTIHASIHATQTMMNLYVHLEPAYAVRPVYVNSILHVLLTAVAN